MLNQNFFNQANKVLPTMPKPIMPIFFIKIILKDFLNFYIIFFDEFLPPGFVFFRPG
jgi:hypothetical protein